MISPLSLIYTTFPSEEVALTLTRQLLEEKLLACVNILGPIQSLYMWEEKVKKSLEIAVLLKTTKEKVPSAIKRLQSLHPYEVPAILEIPIGQSFAPFEQWVCHMVQR